MRFSDGPGVVLWDGSRHICSMDLIGTELPLSALRAEATAIWFSGPICHVCTLEGEQSTLWFPEGASEPLSLAGRFAVSVIYWATS